MTTTSSTGASVSTTSLTGLGLSGLSSGLDTSGIITKLMAIETQPQTLLKHRLSNVSTYRNALQTVNSQLATIAAAAKTAATAGSLTAFSASSDTAGVTAAADATAGTGSLSFTVDKVASAQVSVSAPMTSWPDTASSTPSITLTIGSGASARTLPPITAASSNLDDVVEAVNKAATGVTATKVAAGTDASGVTQYRLQFRSNSTGAASAFSIAQGADAAPTPLPTTTVSDAQDAQITVYGGTDAASTVTSASNTFTGLLTGVDVTVSAKTTSPATISVTPDSSKAASTASSLASSLIALFSTIATDSAITTSSSTSGGTSSTSTSGGVFTGDTTIRALNDQLLSAATGSINGKSPSSIGIILTKDGTVVFDQGAFTSAMASDPAGTVAMFQTIAGNVATAASAASDPFAGTLTQKITSEQGQESSLTSEISAWDGRLATIQQTYQTQFNNLETALNSLSSQASYLTSQLSGLQTTYGSSK